MQKSGWFLMYNLVTFDPHIGERSYEESLPLNATTEISARDEARKRWEGEILKKRGMFDIEKMVDVLNPRLAFVVEEPLFP